MQRIWSFIAGGIVVLTAGLLLVLWRGMNATPIRTASLQAASADDVKARVPEKFAKLPLYFVENRGQVDARVAFYAQGRNKTIYFTERGLTLVLHQPSLPQAEPALLHDEASTRAIQTRYTLQLEFVEARSDLHPVGREQTDAVFSYFKGTRDEWQVGLKSYAQVIYENVWPGIDLIYAGTVNRMKYSFVVKPGADPNQIRLQWHGATGLAVNADGGLDVQTPAGGFTDERPVSWQEQDGARREIATTYRLNSQHDAPEYGFRLGAYDRSRELVIDPVVLVYCGFISGSNVDSGNGIAVDNLGNAYVTGATDSSVAEGFPVAVGPSLTDGGSPYLSSDAFVAKVKADGTGLLYCGYIAGGGFDLGMGIAVDNAGNAYVVGNTFSVGGFPVLIGPGTSYSGEGDVFVAKVSADGTRLLYSGYIGGSAEEQGRGIAVDEAGNAYVTGDTISSQAHGFPVKTGPDTTQNGSRDVFVAKVKANGSELEYCGYIGGSESDVSGGIALDSAGNVYLSGETSSSETQGFPVRVGPDTTFNGDSDAFVAKVSASGTGLEYCGYIGGNGGESGKGIAIDRMGNAYVAGNVDAPGTLSFPVFVGPGLIPNGGADVFVAKVNAAGTGLVYCGYLGSSDNDSAQGIAVDRYGNAFVTGANSLLPTRGLPRFRIPDPELARNSEAFVVKVPTNGLGVVFSRYLGGDMPDGGNAIAVDPAGRIYVTGASFSGTGFPVTVGPGLTPNGSIEAFVAKLRENQSPIAKCHSVTVTAGTNCTANATLDNGSYDPDDDTFTLSQIPPGPYRLGRTSVTLHATDQYGATSECAATVTVVDKTPPAITNLNANPAVLWPPNHKFEYVTVNYAIADNCDNATALNCQLSVQSNEPVEGPGEGNPAPDWIVIDAHHVWLRAERFASGHGRVYTLTLRCTDRGGNTREVSTKINVPRTQGK